MSREQIKNAMNGKSKSKNGLNIPAIKTVLLPYLEVLNLTREELNTKNRKSLEDLLSLIFVEEEKNEEKKEEKKIENITKYEDFSTNDLIYNILSNNTYLDINTNILRDDVDFWKNRLKQLGVVNMWEGKSGEEAFEIFTRVLTRSGYVTYGSERYEDVNELLLRAINDGDHGLVVQMLDSGADNFIRATKEAYDAGFREGHLILDTITKYREKRN